jgi:hypothetical protein
MGNSFIGPNWIDAHLFRLSKQCPAKVRHFLDNRPINEKNLETVPFHTVSQRLLKNLLRFLLAKQSVNLRGEDLSEVLANTADWILNGQEPIVFDGFASFQDRFLGKSTMMEKVDGVVRLYQVEAKAITMSKSQVNFDPKYSGNWVRRMQKSAFNHWVFTKAFPEITFQSFILFPKKQVSIGLEGLSEVLYSSDRQVLFDEAMQWDNLPPYQNYFVSFRVDQAFRPQHLGLLNKTKEELQNTDFEQLYTEEQTLEILESAILDTVALVENTEVAKAPLGMHCKDCEFRLEQTPNDLSTGFGICWSSRLKSAKPDLVFDLVGTSGREYVEQKLYTQDQVSVSETFTKDIQNISEKQTPLNFEDRKSLQIARAKGLSIPEEIIQPALFEKMGNWKFPLYFLDFETITLSVSNHFYGKPYHTYVPQYSIHRLDEDGELTHFHWMSGRLDEFIEIRILLALYDVIMEEPGTLIHFSPTEQVLLREMKKNVRYRSSIHPDDKAKVQQMFSTYTKHKSMVDIKLLLENHYYNHYMGGSLSLKAIYDSFCQFTDRENLYHSLGEGHVRNGNDALNTLFAYYCDLKLTDDERESLRVELLDYCAIDTLSMVEIVQYFQNKIK